MIKRIDFNNLEKKKKKRPWYVVLSVLLIVVISQLVVTNILAVQGDKYSNLETETIQISRENQNLRKDLAQKTSLSHLYELSSNLGFISPTEILYVGGTESVASLLPQNNQ